MIQKSQIARSTLHEGLAKGRAYLQLLKLRLSLLVTLSGVFSYAMAAGAGVQVRYLWLIGLGGLLLTVSANALNQILEQGYDADMKRTADRPLPSGRLNLSEALIFALLLGGLGVWVMGAVFNLPAALLGIISLLLYAFVYTPMKRISPFSVFIGAVPGALPMLIGWVAFTGELGLGGWILFAFQFFWQFPHFWAIAWLLDEDYQRAGFKMLPSSAGKTKFSALLILVYTLCLVPLPLFAWQSGLVSGWAAVGLAVLGIMFSLPAWQLFKTREGKAAKRLMFASFLYLPLIEGVFLLG